MNEGPDAEEPDDEAEGANDPSDEQGVEDDPDATEPIHPVSPLLGPHLSALVGMSDVIKNMQANLAPALRITLPAWPRIAVNMQVYEAMQGSMLDSVRVAQLAANVARIDTQFLQSFAGIAKAVQAQQEQIAKILQAGLLSLDGIYPPNWHGVDGIDTGLIEQIVLDEGIPLVAVPRAATVQLLIDAPDAKTRRAVVSRRWRSITTDCETSLRGYQRGDTADLVGFARKAVAALRGGHPEAAQALASNLLDSLARRHFNADLKVVTTAHRKGQRFEIDDYTVRVAFAMAPIWAAYREFWPNNGDPIPRGFTRHASAHAVSTAQYSRVNTVIALMLVTSLLWVLEDQDSRQHFRAS